MDGSGPLCSMTMRGRQPNPLGESLNPRQKRVMGIVGLALLLVLGGVGAWAASDSGSYGRSRNGCVNVNTPSSTGGALLHVCGAGARSLCASAYTGHDELARLTRPECRLAGIAPGSPATATATPAGG
jgi:hypothetical protein